MDSPLGPGASGKTVFDMAVADMAAFNKAAFNKARRARPLGQRMVTP